MSVTTEAGRAVKTSPVELSVVVPVYNEAPDLPSMVNGITPHLDRVVGRGRWQFVLVDNGSVDGSSEIIDRIVATWPGSVALHLARPDYGEALAKGLMALVSIKGRDAVRLARFQSVATPVQPLSGGWT